MGIQTKIVHVIPSLTGGGAELVAAKIIEHQLAEFECHVIFWDQGSAQNWVTGATYHKLSTRRKGALGMVSLAFQLRKILVQLKPKGVIAHLLFGNLVAFLATAMFLRVTTVLVHHNSAAYDSKLKNLLLFSVYKLSNVVAVSRDVAKYLNSNGVTCVETIPNPLTLAQKVQNRYPRDCHAPVKAVAVGRLAHQKNYPYMFNAVRELERAIELDIYGPGDEVAYESDIINLPENVKVAFKGQISPELLMSVLEQYDVFLMTSDFEGEPSSLLEAASLGVPIVGRRVQGLESAVEKVGGFLPNEDTPKEFAKAILVALSQGKNRVAASDWISSHNPAVASHRYCILVGSV